MLYSFKGSPYLVLPFRGHLGSSAPVSSFGLFWAFVPPPGTGGVKQNRYCGNGLLVARGYNPPLPLGEGEGCTLSRYEKKQWQQASGLLALMQPRGASSRLHWEGGYGRSERVQPSSSFRGRGGLHALKELVASRLLGLLASPMALVFVQVATQAVAAGLGSFDGTAADH